MDGDALVKTLCHYDSSVSSRDGYSSRLNARSFRSFARAVAFSGSLPLVALSAVDAAAQTGATEELGKKLVSEPVLVELIKVIPSLFWSILAIVVVLIFYRPIRNQLLPLVTGLKIGGIECSFVREAIQASAALARKHPRWQVRVSEDQARLVMDRASRHLALLQGARILWVDDVPENNFNEIKMFHQLRADVETAKSTEEAVARISKQAYDIVLSDLRRGDDGAAGLKMLHQLTSTHPDLPVVFYVGEVQPEKGVPPFAVGLTNRPDELLHLVLDVLERRKR